MNWLLFFALVAISITAKFLSEHPDNTFEKLAIAAIYISCSAIAGVIVPLEQTDLGLAVFLVPLAGDTAVKILRYFEMQRLGSRYG